MPTRVFRVEMRRVVGQPLGIVGMPIPEEGGILVTEVSGQDARKVLIPGDRILQTNGVTIKSSTELNEAIARNSHKVSFQVARTTATHRSEREEPQLLQLRLLVTKKELAGIKISTSLVVSGTGAEGKLRSGDVILSVQNESVQSLPGLLERVQQVQEQGLSVGVQRLQRSNLELRSACQPPKQLEKLFSRHDGYDYQAVQVDVQQNPKKDLGLSVIQSEQKVFVSQLEPNSHAVAVFQILDRILVIDTEPVWPILHTQDAIVAKHGRFPALIEHPASVAAHLDVIKAFPQPGLECHVRMGSAFGYQNDPERCQR